MMQYLTEPQIVTWIYKMFEHAMDKRWYETYWAIDLHGSIIRPNFSKEPQKIQYYPFAKEAMQLLTKRKDIILFTYTASYPEQLKSYLVQFKEDLIEFNYINENPEISEEKGHFGDFKHKPYFNVLIDDKTGFDPETDWEYIYDLLVWYENYNIKPDPKWSAKF